MTDLGTELKNSIRMKSETRLYSPNLETGEHVKLGQENPKRLFSTKRGTKKGNNYTV